VTGSIAHEIPHEWLCLRNTRVVFGLHRIREFRVARSALR